MATSEPCASLVEALREQCTEQLRRKYVLPEHFKENLLKCLPAGIDSLKPCLFLLSKVTFRSDVYDPLELFALWRRVLKEFGASPFIVANFLKIAAKVCEADGLPNVLRSSVEFDAYYTVLISSIYQNVTLGATFFAKLDSVKRHLSEVEIVNLAEVLLVKQYRDWPSVILIFPELLGVMLVINYGDPSFTSELQSLAEQNEFFGDILKECSNKWFKLE